MYDVMYNVMTNNNNKGRGGLCMGGWMDGRLLTIRIVEQREREAAPLLFLSIYYDYYGGGGEEEDEGGFQALQGPSSGWLIQLGWYIWMDGG